MPTEVVRAEENKDAIISRPARLIFYKPRRSSDTLLMLTLAHCLPYWPAILIFVRIISYGHMRGLSVTWTYINHGSTSCPALHWPDFRSKSRKMQSRRGLRAKQNSCTALFCAHFCSENIFSSAVLTKFLTLLNGFCRFELRSGAYGLSVRHKNAYSEHKNRRLLQAPVCCRRRFCSPSSGRLAKIEPFELLWASERIMKRCIIQIANCLTMSICKF